MTSSWRPGARTGRRCRTTGNPLFAPAPVRGHRPAPERSRRRVPGAPSRPGRFGPSRLRLGRFEPAVPGGTGQGSGSTSRRKPRADRNVDRCSRCSSHASHVLRRDGSWIFGLFQRSAVVAGRPQPRAEHLGGPSGPTGPSTPDRSAHGGIVTPRSLPAKPAGAPSGRPDRTRTSGAGWPTDAQTWSCRATTGEAARQRENGTHVTPLSVYPHPVVFWRNWRRPTGRPGAPIAGPVPRYGAGRRRPGGRLVVRRELPGLGVARRAIVRRLVRP